MATTGILGRETNLLGCLSGETIARIFVANFVVGREPLTEGTSACVRTVLEIINPRELVITWSDGESEKAMAGGMAAFNSTIACLKDAEWRHTPRYWDWTQEKGTESRPS